MTPTKTDMKQFSDLAGGNWQYGGTFVVPGGWFVSIWEPGIAFPKGRVHVRYMHDDVFRADIGTLEDSPETLAENLKKYLDSNPLYY